MRDHIMSKLSILLSTAALALCGCAQQPHTSGPLPLPMTHTASTDWTIAAQPDADDVQTDEDSDGATLEDRARAVLGNKPLRGTLPDAELNQELLFKFLMSEIAAQRGDTRLAAQGYLDMAKSTRDPIVPSTTSANSRRENRHDDVRRTAVAEPTTSSPLSGRMQSLAMNSAMAQRGCQRSRRKTWRLYRQITLPGRNLSSRAMLGIL